jgi:hypothetical protein
MAKFKNFSQFIKEADEDTTSFSLSDADIAADEQKPKEDTEQVEDTVPKEDETKINDAKPDEDEEKKDDKDEKKEEPKEMGDKEIKALKVVVPSFQLVLNGKFEHEHDDSAAVDVTGTSFEFDSFQKEIENVLKKVVGQAVEASLKEQGVLPNNWKFNNYVGSYSAVFPKKFFFEETKETSTIGTEPTSPSE